MPPKLAGNSNLYPYDPDLIRVIRDPIYGKR